MSVFYTPHVFDMRQRIASGPVIIVYYFLLADYLADQIDEICIYIYIITIFTLICDIWV